MTEDSDEDNPASVSAAFIDRITASLRRLGTRLEVAPREPAHHPAGTGGAVSLAAIAYFRGDWKCNSRDGVFHHPVSGVPRFVE